MNNDLISRQAILKRIEKIRYGVQMMDDTHRASIIMNGMYLCEEAVRNLPSAQPHWIPVTERLPEDNTEVFVYLFDNQPYIAWICDGHWRTEEFEVERENEPVAWMPLPEPYKERQDDNS